MADAVDIAPVLILDDLAKAEASIKRKRARSDSDTFLFDPKAFQDANENLILESYQLTNEELRTWAMQITDLRQEIKSKAARFDDPPASVPAMLVTPRSRKGMKYSARQECSS